MNRPLILAVALLVSGCSPLFVTRDFPEVPENLMKAPRPITPMSSLLPKTVEPTTPNSSPSGVTLEDASSLISKNNVSSTLNSEQLIELQQWIIQQRQIFNLRSTK